MTTQLEQAIAHYEAALKEAFPRGASGDVFHHWNEARKALEQPAQDVDWEKLYRLEVKKKEALAAKYERDTGKKLTYVVPMQQPAQDEPVAGQSRFPNVAWSQCEVEHVRMVLDNPHEWKGYEVRYLYTRPQAREPVALNREYAQRLIEALHENGDPVSVDAAEEFERLLTRPQAREPLTVEQIDDIGSEFSDEFGMIAPDSWEDFARAIEAAHGIGEKK